MNGLIKFFSLDKYLGLYDSVEYVKSPPDPTNGGRLIHKRGKGITFVFSFVFLFWFSMTVEVISGRARADWFFAVVIFALITSVVGIVCGILIMNKLLKCKKILNAYYIFCVAPNILILTAFFFIFFLAFAELSGIEALILEVVNFLIYRAILKACLRYVCIRYLEIFKNEDVAAYIEKYTKHENDDFLN